MGGTQPVSRSASAVIPGHTTTRPLADILLVALLCCTYLFSVAVEWCVRQCWHVMHIHIQHFKPIILEISRGRNGLLMRLHAQTQKTLSNQQQAVCIVWCWIPTISIKECECWQLQPSASRLRIVVLLSRQILISWGELLHHALQLNFLHWQPHWVYCQVFAQKLDLAFCCQMSVSIITVDVLHGHHCCNWPNSIMVALEARVLL